jgi:hypothetical protein
VAWPQNHSDGFRRFGLKTGGDGSHLFGLKIIGDSFQRFDLKINVTVCWFGPQNQVGFGLSVAPQN